MKSPKNGNQSGNQTSFVCYGDIRFLWGQRKQNPWRARSGNPSATSLPLFTLTHCPQVCGSGRDGLGPQCSTSARVHPLASSSYRRLGEHQQGRRKKRGWNTFSAGPPVGFSVLPSDPQLRLQLLWGGLCHCTPMTTFSFLYSSPLHHYKSAP